MASYATADDLITRYDVEVLCDLVGDDRSPVSRLDVKTHPTLLESLVSGSGRVDMQLRVGKRYTPAQLEDLDDNSTAVLKDIVCCFAVAWLFRRRPGVHEEMAKSIREASDEDAKRLASGENVFGLSDDDPHIDAGIPQLSGPTSVQIENRNFLAARLAGNHIPSIEDRNPLDRG